MADNLQPMDLPLTFTTPDIQQEIGAPAEEIRKPSFGLSMANTAYSAIAEGSTNTIGKWIDTNVIMPYITDSDRPKLDQDKVDQLWAGAGIPDKAPNANQYNDVAIYTLLDAAKRRQVMRDVDQATEFGAGSIARGGAMLGLSVLDPVNFATGLFPAGAAFKAIGLSKAAAQMTALELAGQSATGLGTRIGARALTGAIEGAVGNIPLEAITAPMRSTMGEDYTAMDSVRNIALGSAIGGGIHIITGGLRPLLSKSIEPENTKVSDFINKIPDQERANYISQDGRLTEQGYKAFVSNEISTKFGDIESIKQTTNPNLQLKLLDTSEDFKGFNLEQDQSLSIKDDFNQAIDILNKQGSDESVSIATPEAEKLANWMGENTTTPRMISEVLNNYQDRVNAVIKQQANNSQDSVLPINKSQILQEEINKIQPTAAELAEIATPETREKVLTLAAAQLEDEKYPTVNALLKSDMNINKADMNDFKSEVSRMNDLENSYTTDNVPQMPKVDKEIPFENNIDYEKGIIELRAQQEQIKQLSELKLYSQDKTLNPEKVKDYGSNVAALKAEIIKQFGKDGTKLLEAGKLKVVESVADLPNGPHPEIAKGVTFVGGSAYIVANNIDPVKLKGIVLHEVGIHSSIRNFLGEKGFNDLINQMNNFLDTDPRLRNILEYAVPKDTPAKYIDEERLAYMVENMQDAPFVKQLIAKVKAWLFKNFPSLRNVMSLNDNDIAALSLASLRSYAREATPERMGKGSFYSVMKNLIEESQNEIDELDDILVETDKLRTALLSDAETIADASDVNTFTNYIRAELTSIDKESAAQIYQDMQGALARSNEEAMPNPAEYAVKYAIDKLQYGLESHKVALLHDRAIKQRVSEYLTRSWTGREEAGLRSLLIGTSQTADGARAHTVGDAIRNNKRIWTGNLDTGLSKLGIDKLFYNGSLNDDLQRAMWLLEDGADVSHLQPEAVAAAKHIMSIYDGITDSMRKNGLIVNKVEHYLANQQSLHNQTKIKAAGYENWKQTILPLLDVRKTTEAMNIKPSDLNDEILEGIYKGFADGEHIGASGASGGKDSSGNSTGPANLNGFTSASPFSSVKQKQRKLFFKDAEAVIQYRNAYGDLDFQAAIINTIESNSKKLGLLQTLGVNYERNLREISRQFIDSASTPESRTKLRTFASGNMENMLRSIDGRADKPFSQGWARFGSNQRAIQSMARLGSATLSAITDLTNAAGFLNRKGMGGIVYNLLDQGIKTFTKFSPERKQMIGSMGIFADSVLQNAYRDGNADTSIGKTLSKWTSRFFKITGLDAWTNSTRLAAADSLMNHMSGFTNRDFGSLPTSLQRSLKLFDIGNEEWSLLRQTNQRQVDGNNYLVADEISNIRDKIQSLLAAKGATGQALELATDRYIDQLKTKLINFYHDGLSHMVIEPDAATKYYQTWGGLNPGSAGGEIARYAMQFKSFSVGYMRKILFDQIYETHDSVLFGNRKEGGRFWQRENVMNSYLLDLSREGISQKMHLAKYIAATAVMGYIAGALKDASKGKEPRPFFDKDGDINKATLTAALLQGGGLGIFGDFAFGDYNRFGGGLADTLVGPVIGTAGDIMSIVAASREGKDVKAKTANLLINNTPFINAFYTRTAFNYLFFYGLQDYLNPGYLRRMQRNLKKQNDQEFIFPPSQDAIRFN